MIVSQSEKLIFIHIQRTGGSTIVSLLKEQYGERIEIVSQHGNAKSPEKHLLQENRDFFTFTFVRNPWARILSWYLLINKKNHSEMKDERIKFERFLEYDLAFDPGDLDFHYNQLDYLTDESGVIVTDHIYRYENYQNEVRSLFNSLNLPLVNIPKMNSSMPISYRDYYTINSRELIAQKCKRDTDYFGYTF